MDVTVNMTAEEFQEFMEWRRDRNNYTAIMEEWNRHGPLKKIRNGPERSRSWTRNTRWNC